MVSREQEVKAMVISLIAILNIETENNPLLLSKIEIKIKEILDLKAFEDYIESKFNYEKYKYLTGYQKFIALVKDFKEDYIPNLDDEINYKINNYSSMLVNKITSIYNEVHFVIQTKGISIKNINLKLTLEKNGFKNKDLLVIEKIGYDKAYDLSRYNIPYLEELINDTVLRMTILKHYPQLDCKSDSKTIPFIENIFIKRVC